MWLNFKLHSPRWPRPTGLWSTWTTETPSPQWCHQKSRPCKIRWTRDDQDPSESQAFIQLNVAVLLHDELSVVVTKAWQQLSGSPLQEVVEGVGGTFLHRDLIAVAPDLQTGQRNPDVQRTVELKQTEERRLGSSSTAHWNGLWLQEGQRSQSHPVHLVGHVQHAVDDGFIVLLVIQELWGADMTFSEII